LNPLLRKFKTASRFSLKEWKILTKAYFLLLKAQVFLLFLPQQSVEKALAGPKYFHHSEKLPFLPKLKLLELFRIAWRYQPLKPNCLPTSLALQTFLTRYGFPAQLQIGVRKENGGLKAHSWVEVDEKCSITADPSFDFASLHEITNGKE